MSRTKRTPGYVYAICVKGEWGRYKVGRAADPDARLAGLQTGHPRELVILRRYRTLNMERDEKRMHRILGDFRVRGEWFDCKVKTIDLAWRQVKARRGPINPTVGRTLAELADDYGRLL